MKNNIVDVFYDIFDPLSTVFHAKYCFTPWKRKTMSLQNNASVGVSDADVVSGVVTKNATSGVVRLNATLVNAVDDAAAATAGVPVGGLYRNGSVVMVRVA
ncbi:MAG TPA: hypothetical protein VFM18_13535 [Methanosarcina sp.]|nr:hypothetical protein [Methanosarcina sp.]